MPILISPDERSLLLKCPHEIRQLIYRYIIPINQTLPFVILGIEEDHFIVVRGKYFSSFDASILAVCRLLNGECTALLSENNMFELDLCPQAALPPSSHRRLSCQQLSKLRRCHVNVSFKAVFTRRRECYRENVFDEALQIRQLAHRVSDCLEQARLNILFLSVCSDTADSLGRRVSARALLKVVQSNPISWARHVFLYQTLRPVLDVFVKVRNVIRVDMLGALPGSSCDACFEGGSRLKAARKALAGRRDFDCRERGLTPSQRFWLDRGGELSHTFKLRERVGGKNRIWALQLGPRRRSQRLVPWPYSPERSVTGPRYLLTMEQEELTLEQAQAVDYTSKTIESLLGTF